MISHKFFIFCWLEASHKFCSHSRVEFTKRYKYPGVRDHGTIFESVHYNSYRHFCSKMGGMVAQSSHWFIAIPSPARKKILVRSHGLEIILHGIQLHRLGSWFYTMSYPSFLMKGRTCLQLSNFLCLPPTSRVSRSSGLSFILSLSLLVQAGSIYIDTSYKSYEGSLHYKKPHPKFLSLK